MRPFARLQLQVLDVILNYMFCHQLASCTPLLFFPAWTKKTSPSVHRCAFGSYLFANSALGGPSIIQVYLVIAQCVPFCSASLYRRVLGTTQGTYQGRPGLLQQLQGPSRNPGDHPGNQGTTPGDPLGTQRSLGTLGTTQESGGPPGNPVTIWEARGPGTQGTTREPRGHPGIHGDHPGVPPSKPVDPPQHQRGTLCVRPVVRFEPASVSPMLGSRCGTGGVQEEENMKKMKKIKTGAGGVPPPCFFHSPCFASFSFFLFSCFQVF